MRELAAFGVDAFAVRTDLDDPESIRESVAAVVEEFGRLDMLVNNAGVFESAALEKIRSSSGTTCSRPTPARRFWWRRRRIRICARRSGRIVNIGSLGGMHPWATHAHYCTSKAALHMLSQTMAKAWAPEISVNCVAPGMIVQGEVGEAYVHFARTHADAAQWDSRGCGGGGAVLRDRRRISSPGSCWPWMAGWGCRGRVRWFD